MAEPEAQRRNDSAEGGKLYTLSEISQRTGISMPTLQRYKKLYQDRIFAAPMIVRLSSSERSV